MAKMSTEDAVIASVSPFQLFPYKEQLLKKMGLCREAFLSLIKQFSCNGVRKPDCLVETIIPVPQIDNYRTKCEFSLGLNDDKRPVVGFRITKFRKGDLLVGSPECCRQIPKNVVSVCKKFEKFLVKFDDKPLFVGVTADGKPLNTGFWRQITVKWSQTDLMLMVIVHPQDFTTEQINAEKRNLVDFFMSDFSINISDLDLVDNPLVTSLYFQQLRNLSDTPGYELLAGAPYIYDIVLNKRFRISPASFFQSSSRAAEVLYAAIGEVGKLDKSKTLLLDVCCGTGTIGICLAKSCFKVIGFDVVDDAVKDAKVNAKCNDVKNIEFLAGKAEVVFRTEICERVTNELNSKAELEVVAVVDPPRAGLHTKVMISIRDYEAIKKVVFVSCDPKAAVKNFIDLCRPVSNKFPGMSFKLKKIQPVDMFPHTNHFEWIMLFER